MSVAASRLRLWREKPPVFVREVFGVEPDAWQDDVLEAFPHHQRICMKACKGPGKTTVEAWLGWNFLLTRPHPKVAATSISGDNLADGLWSEMAKWQARSELLQSAFSWTKTRIFAKAHPETWWMSARTWSKSASSQQQADTLAGLHADYMLFLIDESGGQPRAVMAAAEAALSTGIETKLVQAGNPTDLNGPLYDACTRERDLWYIVEITSDPDDPKRTPRVSADWAREQIRKYGRDNPWVLVNVFGKFPPASINQLIGPDAVREAMTRHLRPSDYEWAAKVLGVDVARQGDDQSVIFPRQGKATWMPQRLRNVDGPVGAGHVARKWREWGADACFVDGTGGWGYTWIDPLRSMGFSPVAVQFSGEPLDRQFYNKRTEMIWSACQWVREGGALPDSPELLAEMCAHTYTFRGDRLWVLEKDQVKLEIGRSPDELDALALTFAAPVAPVVTRGFGARHAVPQYDPLEHA